LDYSFDNVGAYTAKGRMRNGTARSL
jgi:hypothetical protein